MIPSGVSNFPRHNISLFKERINPGCSNTPRMLHQPVFRNPSAIPLMLRNTACSRSARFDSDKFFVQAGARVRPGCNLTGRRMDSATGSSAAAFHCYQVFLFDLSRRKSSRVFCQTEISVAGKFLFRFFLCCFGLMRHILLNRKLRRTST